MENVVSKIVLDLYSIEIQPQISRPEPEFGDFATNIALQLAGRIGKSPRDIAMEIAEHLRSTGEYSKVEVAGPGFINISLSDSALLQKATSVPAKIYQDVSYVTEYSCPNAFKELHTGHLYQTILGDVIARLIENAGATVHRTSFGGDVGLHVAKCMYGIIMELDGEQPEKLNSISTDPFERATWISKCYVTGSGAYEQEESAKEQNQVETADRLPENGKQIGAQAHDPAQRGEQQQAAEHGERQAETARTVALMRRQAPDHDRNEDDVVYTEHDLERGEHGESYPDIGVEQ